MPPLLPKILTYSAAVLLVSMGLFINFSPASAVSDSDNNTGSAPETKYQEFPSLNLSGGDLQTSEELDYYQSEVIKADFDFNAVGFSWKQPQNNTYQIKIRTGTGPDSLSSWKTLTLMSDLKDGEDQTATDLYFPDQKSSYFQYQIELVEGDQLIVEEFKPVCLDSTASDFQTGETIQSNTSPYIISRAGWGCNESLMTWTPQYATVKKVIVHHTAGPNNPSDPKATIRGIYYYHAVTLGWGDIGYNFLADQYGNVYQGRKGNNGVIGGHAYGYNDGSVGVSVLGTFTYVAPTSAARAAVEKVSAWKSAYNGFAPHLKSNWKDKYTYNVGGHRDYNSTACPGSVFYSYLPTIRINAYNRLKNYEPGRITDLRAAARQSDQVELEWTARGAFWDYGTVSAYQVLYSTTPISNLSSFRLAALNNPTTPKVPGSLQRATITGLSPGVKYYFTIRAKNWEGKWSTLSPNALDFTKPEVDFLDSDITAQTAPGGDLYLWKTYNFDTDLDGTLRVEIQGHADGSSTDDDDLKLVLDGVDYGWNNEYALSGDVLDGKLKTIVVEASSTAGSHTLQLWADETPTLHNLYVDGPGCQEKNFAIYPQEQSPDLNVALFKTYQFEISEAGDYTIEISATAESHGSLDDDDLRFVVDSQDYGWNEATSFDGNGEKGREKTVTVNQNLTVGSHTIEIYADETPFLNTVEVYPAAGLQQLSALASNQKGKSADLNCTLWRVKQFNSGAGPAKIRVQVTADDNGSLDDDDAKIVLDGTDYHWNSNKGFNGSLDKDRSRTIVINQVLTAGIHTLEVHIDETPNLEDIRIFAAPATEEYLVETYPEETSPYLSVALWKDADYSFNLTSTTAVKIEVVGAAASNSSSDDDDLKLVLVKTDNPTATYDYEWNSEYALNGAGLIGASKLITINRTLEAGDYKLQVWGDVTPTLNSVIISEN
jgi:hypothetical protein